ncbi:MAG: 2-succinyl-5-enolpyruvyl-6-hydroxy-3-cyclohexene-1-carboxylic-acid synthase [Prevotella sp.]|nr:2-succinyl-5-enolpyruvyl-6-hydroxy-3-cyclohexene-1-carboxylic-acid synthase [Prevotella sp.]
MFSNIDNVNILTGVLASHGVRRVVVCPGSRNAPIVHNFNEAKGITCYPVTDERSAGFVAMGIAMGSSSLEPDPVVVCVTSGSALLNLYPAVCEAYYQKLPLIVISADRPEAWIGQQDGQTLPQANVFGTMVNKSVNLPIVTSEEQAWYCERLINEAIYDCMYRKVGPVHINIQIPEPLYQFTEAELPKVNSVTYVQSNEFKSNAALMLDFMRAKKPMVVMGQDYPHARSRAIGFLSSRAVMLVEPTTLNLPDKYHLDSDFEGNPKVVNFDEVLYRMGDDEDYMPDFILYVGGNLVSKRLKLFLRLAAKKGATVWRASADGDYIDTFMHVDKIFQCDVDQMALEMMSYESFSEDHVNAYRERWDKVLLAAKHHASDYEPPFCSMAAVKAFQTAYEALPKDDILESRLVYGNSMAIRLACIYSHYYVHCNRGVNGIEGTLSSAVGLSIYLSESHCSDAKSQQKVFCVLGDLSFFYDQNALWNQNLNGSLRILLLNNGGGAIFAKFKGLKESAAREKLVMAEHCTSAYHICQAQNVDYQNADDMSSLCEGIDWLIHTESDRPMLLEVLTDIETDNQVLEEYYNSLELSSE